MNAVAVSGAGEVRLGLGANWRQFALLVIVNAFVGGMVGLERSILPVLAEQEFGLASRTAILSFVASFGIVKALSNLLAGRLSDRLGRKGVLVAGWLFGLPVPLILMFAPSWGWVVFANVLLGVNQGLCWSTAVVMKIDLVGPARRGLALGMNEAAGYIAAAAAALSAGYLAAAYGLRPWPFALGIGFALAGLLLSWLLVKESRGHARAEARASGTAEAMPFREVVALTSWRDRALSAVSQAGLVNNLNDGMVWGLFPLFFAGAGLGLETIALLAALYLGVWGVVQLGTGGLSDRLGRKGLIVGGMWLQAAAIVLVALTSGFAPWATAMVLLGIGTAMVYPTLIAAISDVAHPEWRASAVGVYRLWRDGGYAAGALTAGLVADAFGVEWAIGAVAALTFASGVIVFARMYETLRPATEPPLWARATTDASWAVRPRLAGWIERLARIGVSPEDSEDERLRKAMLTLVASLEATLAIIWGLMYLALGLPQSAAIPLAYSAVSAVSLIHFVRTTRYGFFRASQLSLILLLPFLLQWSLGGFVAGSAVVIWALLAPLGAMMFHGARQSLPWFLAFAALVVASGLTEGRLTPAGVPPPIQAAFFVMNLGGVAAVVYVLLRYFAEQLNDERERSERLLLNVLPAPIAERLKRAPGAIADGFPEATVLFADIVEFTQLSASMPPQKVVELLNDLFSSFDRLADRHGLEKIKTIGDAYMVVGGLPAPRPGHTEAIAELALDMQRDVAARGFQMRIGIHTGPVVAGVIGTKRFIYDLWGDAVNTASRMESNGVPAGIQVTCDAYERLRERYDFEPRGPITVKGKGEMHTYLLKGRRT